MTIIQPVIDKAVEAYREGLDTQEVAGITGLSRSVLDRWQQEGSDTYDDTFAAAVAEARAEYVRESIRTISTSRASDPRNAMWLLEHSPHTRDRYGPRPEPDASAPVTAIVTALAALLPAPAAHRELPRLEDTRAGLPARAREGEEESGE